MIEFTIDTETCTKCGECVADCPARIISMGEEGFPLVPPEREAECYRCQHCLAICPTESVSVLGRDPAKSLPLKGNLPSPESMEILIKGRRAVRRYKDENLEPDLLAKLLEVAWHAPTGINAQPVLFSVVDDREVMARLRKRALDELVRFKDERGFPNEMAIFNDIADIWRDEGVDIIFRHAPHMVITSAPKSAPCPVQDTHIALAYFELYARSQGLGTLWDGLAKSTLEEIAPHLLREMGIPESHQLGYCMLFGKPAVKYRRTVQRGPARVNRVKL